MYRLLWIFIGVLSTSAIAQNIPYGQLILEAKSKKLKIPKPHHDGHLSTINHMGFVSPHTDQATYEFIDFAKGKHVLEIGGSYGLTMLKALRHGCDHYTINDLDHHHLALSAKLVQKEIKHHQLPASIWHKITFNHGEFPSKTGFKPSTFDAVLMSGIIHFYNPSKLDLAVRNVHSVLKKGGKIYINALSPYTKRFEAFIPFFEKRVSEEDPFPGHVDSLAQYCSSNDPKKRYFKHDEFMFIDPLTIKKVFEDRGFKVITCQYAPLGFTSSTWQYDGREIVICIAEKL